MIETVLWTERYRPTTLDEVALSEENRALLRSYVEKAEVPHLLFHGPPGVGKTTVAKILCGALDAMSITLNASNERGIDTIRNKVGTFVRTAGVARWRIVLLDEADAMTAEAQTALRNLMETFSSTGRFILTANYAYKIISPIQSRCVPVEFSAIPMRERARVLARVLKSEGVTAAPDVLFWYAERYTDMRKLLLHAQRSILSHGELRRQDDAGAAEEVWAKVAARDWKGLTALSREPGTDHQEVLRGLFWAIPDDHPRAVKLRLITAKAVHESAWTVDQVIHLLGTCAELIDTLS